jgi:hypothetical protein
MTTACTEDRHHGRPPATHAGTSPTVTTRPIPHGHGQASPSRSSETERRDRTSSVDRSSPRPIGMCVLISVVAINRPVTWRSAGLANRDEIRV